MGGPAEKIELRREVYREDVEKMAAWLEDEKVVQHLNEEQNIAGQLKQLLRSSSLPFFSPQFNHNGTFFLITLRGARPIGFLRLVSKDEGAEMVVVIGERGEWGKGYGTRAIWQGLRHAFFEWRKEKVLAKIHKENVRSKKVFKRVGFEKEKELAAEIKLTFPLEAYLTDFLRVPPL